MAQAELAAINAMSERSRLEVSFEDRFQNELECLYYAKTSSNLTQQFLPANIHGAARRGHP